MTSIKAIAAIALTLMIAVPIGLGYALATEEHEATTWVTESTANSSDLLLNHETPYFMDFLGSQNNKALTQKQVYVGAGVTEWHQVAPDFVTVSSTPSALPTYTQTSGTYSISGMSTNTYTISYSGNPSIGGPDSGASILVNDYAVSSIAISTTAAPLHFQMDLETSERTEHANGPVSASFARDSADGWTVIVTDSFDNTTVYHKVLTWKLVTDADATVTRLTAGYTTLSISGAYSFIAPGPLSIALTKTGGTEYAYAPVNSVVSFDNGSAVVDGVTYTGVTSLGYADAYGGTTLLYDTLIADGLYADPAAGWRLPTVSGAATYDYWQNGQLNDKVTLMVNFSDGAQVFLAPCLAVESSYLFRLTYSDGSLVVKNESTSESFTLGSYTKAMVVMDREKAVVYGVANWPAYGAAATTFNNVTIDYTDLTAPFPYIRMQAVNSEDVSFRADNCEVVAGYFPSTLDKWLDFSELYPQKSLTFTIKSLGVYGDNIQIAGQTLTPVNGKITFTDSEGDPHTVNLRGAVFRFIFNNNAAQTYTISINGIEVSDTALARMYFGGEWSLTTSTSLIGQQTESRVSWAPGEFAFDKTDFAACGLLVAGGLLVGLGMYGQRSGIKFGVLLLICGGAALAYLTFV